MGEPKQLFSIAAHTHAVSFSLVNLCASVLLLAATVMALADIKHQVRLIMEELLLDPDDDVAAASQHWQLGARGRGHRTQQRDLEARFRYNRQRWTRYSSARSAVIVWNRFEVAAGITLIAAIIWFVDAYPG